MVDCSILEPRYNIGNLSVEDYDNGVLHVLSQLTTVGDVRREDFNKFVKLQQDNENHKTFVIKDIETNKVVGIATLLIEIKLIHGYSKVGHIEDVAIDKSVRGKKLGAYIIRYLCELAKSRGCYKTILDCDDENVGFYEKCGLSRRGVEMEYRD